ncbi:aspartyl/asparaginyl beta-hydroxylase [Bombina bombina]|uniref:aspartyl/asparaginyl beta-hydroxylase n=1 Tax=Bombina bombina TaxID=8345 RepID=UPI00235ACF1C|nr:aspartyl/asparaginyl beta-hydroxylase [Bombina bombina]
MAPKHGRNNTGSKRDTKHGKNGKKDGVSGSSFFTWFMVIALLGVWTSVAVVWFDLVDYEEVLAKAKDFRYNLSEVLQGKLGDYDADGDGDFDIEDAKVLLGLKEKSVPEEGSEDIDDPVLQASDKPGIKDDLEEAFEASFREVLSEDDGDDDEHDEEPAVVEETEQVTELELEDALETDNIDVEIEEPKIIATKVQKEELQIQEQPEVAEEQEEELEPVASEEDDEVDETAATEENEEETEVVEDAVEEPEHVAVEESVGLKDAEEEPELADEPAVEEDLEEAEPAGTEAAEEPVIDELRYVDEDEHYHETDIPETQEYETIEESYTTDDEPKTHEPISEDKEDDDDYEVHHTEDEPQEAEPLASDQPGDEQPEDEETEEIVPETSDTIEEETVLASDFSVDDIEEDLYDTAHLAEQDTEKLQEVKEESATDPVEAESVVETEEVRTNEQAAEENTLSEEEKEESADT